MTTERVGNPLGFWASIRANRFRLMGLLIALTVIAAAVYWFQTRSQWVYTSDARVAATMIGVSSEVRSTVVSAAVDVGDRIEKGAVLLRLDDREAVFHLAELEARFAALEAEYRLTQTRHTQTAAVSASRLAEREADLQRSRAALRAADARLEQALAQFERAESLRERGIMSQELWDEARTALTEARQEQEEIRARMTAEEARIAEAEANLLEAQVVSSQLDVLRNRQDEVARQIDAQKVVVERHTLRSPIDGIVDEIFLDVGEQALPGFRAVLVHDPENVWIDANIKETAIARTRVGAPVDVRVDAYAGRMLKGEVTRIRAVATGEFALLPNPNASGVFTKITQRVPVRIALEPHDLILRPGTMVTVAIAAGSED